MATNLILRRMRQQVAGDLLDDELVVRHVVVERIDDPVAIHPHEPRLVLFEAVGIGIAGRIEPDAAPALAEVRRREQPFDLAARTRARRRRPRTSASSSSVGGRPIKSSDSRRSSVLRARRRRRLKPFALQPREHERIDRIAHPSLILDRRHRRAAAARRTPNAARTSPPCSTHLRRISICSGVSVLPESAGGMRTSGSSLVIRLISSLSAGFLRIDDRLGAVNVARVLPNIEPQIGLPLGRIRPMTMKTIVRQDRPHVAREIDRLRRFRRVDYRARTRDRQDRQQRYKNRATPETSCTSMQMLAVVNTSAL